MTTDGLPGGTTPFDDVPPEEPLSEEDAAGRLDDDPTAQPRLPESELAPDDVEPALPPEEFEPDDPEDS
jgi:hypothetical protein